MKTHHIVSTNPKIILFWTARIWGGAALAFLIFFVGAHLFGADGGIGFTSKHEIATFIFFPISTMLGLSIAFKWEGLGAIIILLGAIGLIVLRSDLIMDGNPYMLGLMAPSILFLLYWIIARKK